MRNAKAYATDLLSQTPSVAGFVKTVAGIQQDAFTEGRRQAQGTLIALSQEIDERLARLRAQEHLRARP